MSNFGFPWVWKELSTPRNRELNTENSCRLPDSELSGPRPKRTFIRRALEFEVRPSYRDRVLKTWLEPTQNDTTAISERVQPLPIFFRISHVDFGRAVPSNWHALSALFVAAIAIGSTPPGRRGSAESS
jgi:hypothetical protein